MSTSGITQSTIRRTLQWYHVTSCSLTTRRSPISTLLTHSSFRFLSILFSSCWFRWSRSYLSSSSGCLPLSFAHVWSILSGHHPCVSLTWRVYFSNSRQLAPLWLISQPWFALDYSKYFKIIPGLTTLRVIGVIGVCRSTQPSKSSGSVGDSVSPWSSYHRSLCSTGRIPWSTGPP